MRNPGNLGKLAGLGDPVYGLPVIVVEEGDTALNIAAIRPLSSPGTNSVTIGCVFSGNFQVGWTVSGIPHSKVIDTPHGCDS
jgi:hypothetical protein